MKTNNQPNPIELCRKHDIDPDEKCASCGEKFVDIAQEYGENAVLDSRYSEKLGGRVCFPCVESSESSPQGTVIVYDPKNYEIKKYVVSSVSDMVFKPRTKVFDGVALEDLEWGFWGEEISPIQFEWHSTDPWRGYYEPKAEGWKELHSDCILSYSKDASNLKKFDTSIKEVLWRSGIKFAVIFGRTSNAFSTGYDIYVKEGELATAENKIKLYGLIKTLRKKYRDPERFKLTALTGKDEFNEKDGLLSKGYNLIKQGKSLGEVKQALGI